MPPRGGVRLRMLQRGRPMTGSPLYCAGSRLSSRHRPCRPGSGLRAAALLLAGVLFLLPLAGCKKDTPVGKNFRFPLSAEPRQIDPQVSTDAASVTMVAALFEGLARLDENGEAVPGAADWTGSDDGLTYTFTLRDSLWSDGTAVTAQDFLFGMQRAVLPSTKSSLAEQLFIIEGAKEVNEGTAEPSALGVQAVDEKTLVITLTEPDPDFPEKTASTPYMPCKESFFEGTGGRYGLEEEYVLSNGPFLLKKWNHNENLLLNKNEGYYDAENIYPAAVRYMIGEVEDPVGQMADGLLDAAPIPAESLEAAREAGLTLVAMDDTIQYLWMNNGNEALKSADIRRALRDAVEWELVYEQLSDASLPAEGFAAPASVLTAGEAYRTGGNRLAPSTDAEAAAKALSAGLADAGLTRMPKLTLLCSEDEYSLNLARYLVQSWQKNLSLYFDIEAVSSSELETRVKVGNYQLALYACTAPGSSALDAFGAFATDAVGNYARFSDSGVDSLVSAALLGAAGREEMEALEALLWELCPSVPLSFEKRYVGIPANDSGIIVRPYGGGAFGAPYDFRQAGKLED